MIDRLKTSGFKVDYLQVFELDILRGEQGEEIQKFIHHQEVPKYRQEHHLGTDRPVRAKLFAIDSGEYYTLLLAEEY